MERGPFFRRTLASLLEADVRHVTGWHCRGLTSEAGAVVPLPKLARGRHMLAHMAVFDGPDPVRWDAPCYAAATPWVCAYRDVVVHSSAGLVCWDDVVVEESLLQTAPEVQHYRYLPDHAVALGGQGKLKRVRGTCLSLLSGNHDNYYHWMMDCVARLAAVRPETLAGCDTILVPPFTRGFQAESFAATGLAETHDIRHVAVDETLRVDRLLVPGSIHGHHMPHPGVIALFDVLARRVRHPSRGMPKRIYIDRRDSQNRALRNEAALSDALGTLGFTSCRLEGMSWAEQVVLFQQAEIIVAPHGAGLTNIVFARPGAWLVELQSDRVVRWPFRHLAALRGVNYDCVIGRHADGESWDVSVLHVVGMVEQLLAEMP